ncbi:MAG: hypothetical protein A2V83_04570 [Nitrospirae bacterium RBG_16_64_22]|nr:MAG: hypothetical protein A2V83_04570 [Nitrospirae bacterium RBG_16_64_22]
MVRTIEAVIDTKGDVRLLEPVRLSEAHRAIVIILDTDLAAETSLLTEAALAIDWNRPEEDAAWARLQPAR